MNMNIYDGIKFKSFVVEYVPKQISKSIDNIIKNVYRIKLYDSIMHRSIAVIDYVETKG